MTLTGSTLFGLYINDLTLLCFLSDLFGDHIKLPTVDADFYTKLVLEALPDFIFLETVLA